MLQTHMIFVFLLIYLTNELIFDQGLCQETCQQQNPDFECKNQTPFIFIINFSSPFENIPQVFIVLDLISVDVKTDFRLEIQDITKQSFNLHVACLTGWASCLRLKWYAIDDQRFQIINFFNTIDLIQKTVPHKNKNLNTEIGLITLVSHNYEEVNFKLKIDEITSEDVTVSLIKLPENFGEQIQVGFQIILGPKEAFQEFNFIDSTTNYESIIQEKQNAWFISTFTGMGYPYTDAIRLDKQYQFQESSIYKYSLSTWYSAFTPCSHSHGFISQIINSFFYSINLQKLSIVLIQHSLSVPLISINFTQINRILDSNGEYQVTLDKAFDEVLIDIQIACPVGKMVEAKFNKCYDCSIEKTNFQNFQCSNTAKKIYFKIQYSKQPLTFAELILKQQDNLCQMNQLLYNQKFEEVEIFTLNIKDI
ncbi:unnamed protein product [Paramecium sonneborni]|uniref:H-type lectin domain-containing protein n=1 Tax=Paramecium sonneborni TaxID=65129 RepID=A0A8S1QLU2_9CILI|nr:unnamed protein product [Paramecium sonneborni]